MNADSVKARLKNLVIEEGGTFQEKLITYALERTIYRISISKYKERFTLKGGIFLYALFNKNFARSTMDIDLLAQKISNDESEIKKVFCNIYSIQYDDALRFDLDTLEVHTITAFKKYHGVNVSIIAYLDRTKIPVSIDIGFGDTVYPEKTSMDFPVLLDLNKPQIYTYSIYSAISEKFEAIVSLGLANSRYKDFYDIYELVKNFDLSGKDLKNAIKETFTHRQTSFEDIAAFDENFTHDILRQNRWNAFINKKKAIEKVSFEDAVNLIKCVLMPITTALLNNSEYNRTWIHEELQWK